MRKLMLKWLGGVDAAEYRKLADKHREYCEHVLTGRVLDHRRNGFGVSNLIEEILFDSVENELGSGSKPRNGASRADILETDDMIHQFAQRVAAEIGAFTANLDLRNATEAKWGMPNVRVGTSRLFAAASKGGKVLLRGFAKIWSKEHKDQKISDVLSEEQQKEWAKLPPRVKRAINFAVNEGFQYWK